MDWEQRCIRFCGVVLLSALSLRLWAGGALVPVAHALGSEEAASFLVYLQTGRAAGRTARQMPAATEAAPASAAVEAPRVTFAKADAAVISLSDTCGAKPNVAELLTEELELDLSGDEAKVLIVHTHTTESYTQTADRYEPSGDYRTLDEAHNMLAVGEELARILEAGGISVVHDRQLHDYPSYNDSYSNTAASTKALLEAYPSVRLILDLHRDAAETASGQFATKCSIGGERAAQLMFVMGTDTRLSHPDWQRNMSLACKLQVLLEAENPGICRSLNLSKNRYNQQLGDLALLVEVGSAGNTLHQAKLAVQQLGKAILQLAGASCQ